MRRTLPLIGLLICVSGSLLWARQGSVRTRDGRTIEGDVTEKGEEITIATKAGSITMKSSEVANISYAGGIKEQYEQRLKGLPKDAGSRDHYELARWLFDNREYDLARTETNKAIELDPNNADARLLRQTIDRQAGMQKGRTTPPVGAPGRDGNPLRPPGRNERHLLNPDHINVIRQHEMREDETNVRVRLENDVRNRFVALENLEPRDFNRLPEPRKAIFILQSKKADAEMRQDVRIMSDPAALMEFKRQIQPLLLSGCASSNCHAVGSVNAGSFVLHAPAENDAMTYTNFWYLTQYKAEVAGEGAQSKNPLDSTGAGTKKAIDRLYPGNSLILHYGLPRDMAEYDHPEVPQWNNVFRNTQDPRYRQVVNWIQNTLVAVEPDYGIKDVPLPWANEGEGGQRPPAPQPPPAQGGNAPPPAR